MTNLVTCSARSRKAMPSALFGVLTLGACLGLPSVARADQPRTHDGFYLRLGGGLAYMSNSAEAEGRVGGSGDGTIRGGGLGYEIAVGGAVSPGLILGGGIYGHYIVSPTAEEVRFNLGLSVRADDPLEFDGGLFHLIGPFVDYYFDPRGGLHLQAALGYAGMGLGDGRFRQSGVRVDAHGSSGWGVMVGFGHEWWVSDSWSLGMLGRLTYGRMTGRSDDGNVDWIDSVIVPALLFTATMN